LVRLSDLPEDERAHLAGKQMPPLGPKVWTAPTKAISDLRLALVTTAGLHLRGEDPFRFTDDDLVMSHSSANFDRSGFAEDVNLVFPVHRFKELAHVGKIGSVADIHYSFMGAGLLPEAYEHSAVQVAGLLKQDKVDAVFLTPV
jgi:D-proline reductase (dithiol) PrdB